MPLSVATHCSFSSFLSHESPPFCTSFLFSFLLSSPSPLSLLSSSLPIFSFPFSFLFLQEITLHVICLFSLTSLLLLLSFSLFLFSVLFLSLPFFVFISCLFTHHQHLFFMGINVPSFPQLLTIIHNVIYSLFANSFSN
ncbi:hypothetical protein K457DRAFT_596473 [Linnemannia elongata AG-77]|uniref:Uncharacterized protein n=1 Tax=Linnemannia elongata AG-77 TaxID=1314771 RepID=A0A197JV49_9FUNG|nr:hypothetical protein K457DRAFT_596473 [Linnemannia elongata AG-77]